MTNASLTLLDTWELFTEVNLHDVQRYVLSALDYYLKHVEWSLVNFDMMMDCVSHAFVSDLDSAVNEKLMQTFRIIQSSNIELSYDHELLTNAVGRLFLNNSCDIFQRLFRSVCSDRRIKLVFYFRITILTLALLLLYLNSRGEMRFCDERILVEMPANIDEITEIFTRYIALQIKAIFISPLLSIFRPWQFITMHEASILTKALVDIIEQRDISIYSILPQYFDMQVAKTIAFLSPKDLFSPDYVLSSLFTILGNREAAILGLDVCKTKRLRATKVCGPSVKTWEMIKEGKGEIRLNEISIQCKEHDKNSTVLIYHIDCHGILHCCVLNGEVKLLAFPRIDQEDLISKMEMLLKPCNVKVPRDYSFFPDMKDEIDPPSSKASTAPTVTNREPPEKKSASKSVPQTPLEKATLKLKKLNARWARKYLFKILLHPLKDFIKGNKLIIIPDQFLFLLPFSCLLDENDNSLSKNYSIQITPALHYLLSSFTYTPDSTTMGPAMFVGNPKLDTIVNLEREQSNKPPSPLQHAAVEAQQLAALFNTCATIGDDATKRTVFANLEEVSILHLASHGDPNFGWIYLAPDFPLCGPEEEQAYMMRDSDLLFRRMKARLVFLSCCGTARGKVMKEGVFGMARAFLTSDARCVIVTLWPIDDLVTLEFTHIFYTFLCDEKSVCEALQMTMIHFQDSGNPTYELYTSWAPFQVLGEDIRFTREEIKKIRELGNPTCSYFDFDT